MAHTEQGGSSLASGLPPTVPGTEATSAAVAAEVCEDEIDEVLNTGAEFSSKQQS
jgi:hypothetical protein